MTVNELIGKLQTLKDGNTQVFVEVTTDEKRNDSITSEAKGVDFDDSEEGFNTPVLVIF